MSLDWKLRDKLQQATIEGRLRMRTVAEIRAVSCEGQAALPGFESCMVELENGLHCPLFENEGETE